jgi:endonuclease YncB( thermonuclease family)
MRFNKKTQVTGVDRKDVRDHSTTISMLFWVLALVFGAYPAFAGDSLYGKVREVKRADLVVLDYGQGQYELRLAGIDLPREAEIASKAKQLVSDLVLGKNARMRFEGRTREGEMLARLYTDDPRIGIREVAVELVKAGLARRRKGFDFKYGELARAEREAQSARRGLWAVEPK